MEGTGWPDREAEAHISAPALPATCSVTLSKFLSLSGPPFLHLELEVGLEQWFSDQALCSLRVSMEMFLGVRA